MAMTLLPKAGTEYSVRLGRSFAAETADAASVAAFHYRFLPASAEDAAEGRLEKKGRGGRTRLALRMAASGDTHEFHGTTHAAKEGECVLIFDLDAQTATLERLSTVVSDLAPATATATTTTATAPPPQPQQQQQPPAAKRQKQQQQPRQQTLTPTLAAAAPQQQQQSQQHTPITPGDAVVDEVAAMIERDAQLPPLTPTSAASVPPATAGAIKMALASLSQQQQQQLLLQDAADNSDFDSSSDSSSEDSDSSDSDA